MRRSSALLRFALRDLRGGLKNYGVFIACLVLGVTAIVGVAATSRALREGMAEQGATLLGGDINFARAQGGPSDGERSFFDAHGRTSEVVTLRAMGRRTDADQAALVEIKSVDDAYPLLGAVTLTKPDEKPLGALLAPLENAYGIIADPTLGARLHLAKGDRIAIGDGFFTIAGWLEREPDSVGGLGFGPRVLMSRDALAATGLMKPGALARHSLRLVFPRENSGDADVVAFQKLFAEKFPDSGFEIRSRAAPAPQLTRNIEKFAQFLTLIGLTSLVCGGVGVGNSIRGLIDRKRRTLAILKALGASGGEAALFVLLQAFLVALGASLVGAAFGLLLPKILVASFGASLPFAVTPRLHIGDAATGLVFGLLTAFAFAAAPLERARSLPVTQLLRETSMQDAAPNRRGIAVSLLAGGLLFGFALLTSADRLLTAQFGLGVIASFAALYGVARGIMALARRFPHSRRLEARLAIANLHRPGALTPSFLLSLGLGVTLLTALVGIERSLRAEIGESLPNESPSFFFIDIQSAEADAFRAFLVREAPEGAISAVPMLRGRIIRVKGVPAEEVKAAEKARWALEGDRGVTFAQDIPKGSQIVAGQWWPQDYKGEPLVSMEADVAHGLGLGVGDTIAVNVLGRTVTAKVASLRKVNWRSFGINFVLVFSPNVFSGAPFAQLMTLTPTQKPEPAREAVLLADMAKAFPSVAALSLRETLATLDELMRKLSVAIQGAASLAFIISALVLAGALAAGQRARIYEAVILKVLGATRLRLMAVLTLEFALLGAATGAFGLIAGSLAAWQISAHVLDAPWRLDFGAALATAGLSVGFAIFIGLIGTWRALGEKPARHLRDE